MTIGQKLPNFIIVGFGKSGTTSLHYELFHHPDVCLVAGKEASFFNNDSEYERGMEYYFNKHFPHYTGEKAIGDITPAYVVSDTALRRIKNNLGNEVKIIYVIRHPVLRAFSHYIHRIRFQINHPEEVSEDDFIGKFTDSNFDITDSVIKMVSMFSNWLNNLYTIFPSENILPLLYERDFSQDGVHVACEKIERFLGLNSKDDGYTNKRFAGGYLTSVTIIDKPCYIEQKSKKTIFNPGEVVIEHIREPDGYFFEIIKHPSPKQLEWLCSYPNNLTTRLSAHEVNKIYHRYYKEDAMKTAEISGIDLSVWDESYGLAEYKIISSRIQYFD